MSFNLLDRIRNNSSTLTKILGLGILATIWSIHLFYINKHFINIPFYDEWELFLPNQLQSSLQASWLFDFHNEHRIVFTKAIYYLTFILGLGWAGSEILIFNFVIYGILIFTLYRILNRTPFRASYLSLIPLLSIQNIQNNSWTFQNQFHFFLLFTLVSLLIFIRGTSMKHMLGVAIFAVFSSFSFSLGVPFAAGIAVTILLHAIVSGEDIMPKISGAAIIILGISLWFLGYEKPPSHPSLVFPTETIFWSHYGIMIGNGFSVSNSTFGVLILLLNLSLSSLMIAKQPQLLKDRSFLSIQCLLYLVLGGLAIISIGRSGMGLSSANASRYAEVSMFLIPLSICNTVYGYCHLSKKNSYLTRYLLQFGMIFAFLIPFRGLFQFDRSYARYMPARAVGYNCVNDFIKGKGDGFCPSIYPRPIPDRISRAVDLKINF